VPEYKLMATRYVRWLTRTDPKHTVVSQLRERGKCVLDWYLDLDGNDWVKDDD
jgi:hypothetical protein